MIKIKYILIFIFLFSCVISCKAKNLYKNNEVGFSFKIPKDSYLGNEDKGLNNYYIRIYVQKPEDILGGVNKFNEIKSNIEKNIYPNIPNIPANLIKYKKIGRTKIGIDFHRGYDIFSGVIGKRIFFIKNNRLVSIFFQYEFNGPKDMNDKDNLQMVFEEIVDKYYKEAQNKGIKKNQGSYVVKEIENYIMKNKNKKTEIPEEIVKLFILFDKLLDSLKFYN